MFASNVIREGLRTASTHKAQREALRIVRCVIDESLGPNGLTTAEVFRLASRKPPSSTFEVPSHPKNEGPAPLNLGHPVRSVRYLKKTLLPILEGNRVIRMKQIARAPSPPTSQSSDKVKVAASSPKTWAWIPVDPNTVPKPKIPEPPIGTAVGMGEEDWSHLNSRRRRARIRKTPRAKSIVM